MSEHRRRRTEQWSRLASAVLRSMVALRDHIARGSTLLQSHDFRYVIGMPDIKKIDLNLLVVLDALLDERSATRAAARLGYSQPTISGMLVRLRDLYGDPLLVRTQ